MSLIVPNGKSAALLIAFARKPLNVKPATPTATYDDTNCVKLRYQAYPHRKKASFIPLTAILSRNTLTILSAWRVKELRRSC